MNEDQSNTQRISAAIRAAIARFRLERPEAIVSNDAIQTLTGFIDTAFSAKALSEDDLTQLACSAYDFLVRIADVYPEIASAVTKKNLELTEHEPWRPNGIVIDPSSLQQGRTRFWCTIYPFCKPQ